MIFLVPGLGHTLRVNGTAVVSTDPELRELGAVRGRLPVTALVLTVREVLYQCPRALVRSRLWDPARHVDPAALASLDEVLADQVPDLTLEESRPARQHRRPALVSGSGAGRRAPVVRRRACSRKASSGSSSGPKKPASSASSAAASSPPTTSAAKARKNDAPACPPVVSLG